METYRNTEQFMEKFRLLLENGEELPLPVQGSSMAPFLVDRRDLVWVRRPSEPLKAGDIVLYQRSSGQYILHRIQKIQNDSYTMIGDAHHTAEPGIRREQIFGRVSRVFRKGRQLGPGSFCWMFFARIWVRMVPLRPAALKLYGGMQKLFRHFRRKQ